MCLRGNEPFKAKIQERCTSVTKGRLCLCRDSKGFLEEVGKRFVKYKSHLKEHGFLGETLKWMPFEKDPKGNPMHCQANR